ncbi:MAG TPA: ATP-binding protein [Phycisphaerales bacterium]|nr:ATP-binding protein [Phycisphaerales bacterium]
MQDALTNTNPRRIMHMAAIGAFVVLGAMGLLTWQAMRLERREQSAQAQAQFQESLRLALWRIDSAMTPIIAREAARPYFEYEPFYPTKPPETFQASEAPAGASPAAETTTAPSAADTIFADAVRENPSEVLVPSPLLSSTDDFVNLHFQIDAAGSFSSPQVPEGRLRELAEAGYVTPYTLSQTEDRLTKLQALTGAASRSALLWTQAAEADLAEQSKKEAATLTTTSGASAPSGAEEQRTQRQGANTDNEYGARREALTKATTQYNQQAENVARGQQRGLMTKDGRARPPNDDALRDRADTRQATLDVAQESEGKQKFDPAGTPPSAAKPASSPGTPPPGASAPADGDAQPTGGPGLTAWNTGDLIVQGQFTPRWLPAAGSADPELVFVRTVRVGDRTLEQGFWLDWPRLRTALLDPVKPLFPACTIRPVNAPGVPASHELGRMLATIPAELVVDAPDVAASARWTPLRGVLVVVWVLVIASVVAMFGIVRASIELAERRGRFVSAVTHELRTPLTTFCLYSQMLSDGMVPTEDGKRQYARTLHHESIRLTRIVESVLDFARLGRGSKAAFETLTLRELRARIEPGLLAACDRANMRLDVTLTCDADQPVRTDPAILERVLGNLVDNACKYARSDNPDQDHVILTWSIENGRLRATVRDFGPGVPFEEQTRVFDAFVRGRAHAHGSTPGLGLGLALSKGLAEQLGGELRMVQASPGAEFTLDVAAT